MKFAGPFIRSLFLTLLGGSILMPAIASDHDDGVSDNKTQATNLTDLYAFRQDWQTGSQEDSDNLILVMNSFPRALPETQYFFATDATYNFHLTRVPEANINETPTGQEDVRISFQFQEPDENSIQAFTVNITRNGETSSISTTADGQPLQTNPLNRAQEEEDSQDQDGESENQEDSLITNMVNVGGEQAEIFAGLREDPFFFDVQQFFKVRAGAAGLGPKAEFKSPSEAEDFAHEYNVNSIVLSVPMEMLETGVPVQQTVPQPQGEDTQGEGEEQEVARKPIYDVWMTVFRTMEGGEPMQVERLARPAINEGLIISNDNLNAFNQIMPNQDLSEAAAPVLEEAAASLEAFDQLDGSDDLTVEQITTAFLPDVMRVDTSLDIEPGETAYNHSVSGDKSILTSGRKLKDDVVDITLGLLVTGDPSGKPVDDNVSYEGVEGNPAQGHSPLHGAQSAHSDEATFPFLAEPN